jgi:hypothetical protein
MQCGGTIGRPLRFDEKLEGFVCEHCAGRDAFVVSNETADALEALFRLPVAEFVARGIATEVLLELRSLAGLVRRNFLGHELKSFDVLAGILGAA